MINAFEIATAVLPVANMVGKAALSLAVTGTLGAIVETVRPGSLDRVCTPVLSALWSAQEAVGRAADALGDLLASTVWGEVPTGRHGFVGRAKRGAYHGQAGAHRA